MNKHRNSLYEVAGSRLLTWILVTSRHETKMGYFEGLSPLSNGCQLSDFIPYRG